MLHNEVEEYSDELIYHSDKYHKLRVCIGVLKARLGDMKTQVDHLDKLLAQAEGEEPDLDLYDPSGQIDSQIIFLTNMMVEHREKFIELLTQESKYGLEFDLSEPFDGRFISGQPDWIDKHFPYFQTPEEIKRLKETGCIEISPKDSGCSDSVIVSNKLPDSFIQVWWPIHCPFQDDGYIVKSNKKDLWFWFNHEWHDKENFGE